MTTDDTSWHNLCACTHEARWADAISRWAASVWSAYVPHREVIDAVLVRRGLR